ncbi:MAG: D-tyrosyl-tRNA(Tyr) deacylase [Clostridia bacterium]|nr:D-tyrosyl-tRNA(Tyr) deacylase [Clostridia bacterium]
MKIVLQRVLNASVEIEGRVVSSIGKGYLVLFGVSAEDTEEDAKKYAAKIKKLRIFDDSDGKTNLSIDDVGGELLVVSQFTLYADCKKGNRPSFTMAAPPAHAKHIYEVFLAECEALFGKVGHGEFGADMKVSLVNDGPFTVIIDNL